MKAAIATVVIGESYRRHYGNIFEPSVQRYASRHGYDVLLFDRPLSVPELGDVSKFNFTKLLIPVESHLQTYDRLMVLDADILVSREAPPFHTLELDGGIGVVDEWSQPTPAERATYQQAFGFETTARDYYALAGFTLDTSVVPNSGMFICSPASHRRFYTDLSRQWAASQFNHPRGFHYEQSVFGFALQQAGLQRLLPAAWNRIWPLYRSRETASPAARLRAFRRFTEVYADSFLLHLVSGQDHDFAYLLRDR